MAKLSSKYPVSAIVRFATLSLAALWILPIAAQATEVTGSVVDAGTGHDLPCRLYVQNANTLAWYFAKSADAAGSAVEYRKQIGATPSVEMHTTLSAAKFQLLLEPGRYRIRAEYGKEFIPAETEVTVGSEASEFQLTLKRFSNMQKQQ